MIHFITFKKNTVIGNSLMMLIKFVIHVNGNKIII